ncbi:hypothetical protein ACWGQ5_40490, partial [Streptomyces sp. NPDC055722]
SVPALLAPSSNPISSLAPRSHPDTHTHAGRAVFTRARDPWPSTCEQCGADIDPTYDSVASKAKKYGDSPRGCGDCADRAQAEKYRLDEAELAKTIAWANIKPLEPYTNNRTRMESICVDEGCPRDGKPIKVLVKAVRQGATACKYCAQRAIDPDVAVGIMRKKGLVEPATAYVRVDEPWPSTCRRCHGQVQPRLHYDGFARGSRCRAVSGSTSQLPAAPTTPPSASTTTRSSTRWRSTPKLRSIGTADIGALLRWVEFQPASRSRV